jgi:hypothetical protein
VNKDQKLIQDFEKHCLMIQQRTAIAINESPKEKEKRIARARKDYNFFFTHYFPHYADPDNTGNIIECAPYHTRCADLLLKNQIIDLLLEIFRGGAKSTHGNLGFPLFLWINGELKTMLLIGENETKANIHLSCIQAEFENNERLKNDFGNQFNSGSWADGHFVLKDNTAFFSLGLGQSPRGIKNFQNRPDYISSDDLDTKERCKNPARVKEAVEWILEDLRGCFGVWRERYVHLNNNIHKNSILSNIIKSLKKAFHFKINATDKNGDPTWPGKYTREYWEHKKANTPYRSYEREYNNNPIEEGTVFKIDWVLWRKIPPLEKFEYLIAYCDPSFKGTSKNDFKAIKVWGKIGTNLYLIKSFVRQSSVAEMVRWFYDLHESLPDGVICDYVMEANFVQDLLLDEFDVEGNLRGYQLPIRGDKRAKPDKFQRIEALSPLYERGHIFYNVDLKEDSDMVRAVDQLTAFEKGSGAADDSPDADEGAIHILQKRTRVSAWEPRIGARKPNSGNSI